MARFELATASACTLIGLRGSLRPILHLVHLTGHGDNKQTRRQLVHGLALNLALFQRELPHIVTVVVVLAIPVEFGLHVSPGGRKLLKLLLDDQIELMHDLFLELMILRCDLLLHHRRVAHATPNKVITPIYLVCLREKHEGNGLTK